MASITVAPVAVIARTSGFAGSRQGLKSAAKAPVKARASVVVQASGRQMW